MNNQLKGIIKRLNFKEHLLLRLEDDTDAIGTNIERWAYNLSTSPYTIELYADGWLDIHSNAIVLYDGDIDAFEMPCMFCSEETAEKAEHFICENCGVGMCEDCYNSDTEHDGIYNNPIENCEDENIISEIEIMCDGEPAYLCENCYNLAASRAISTIK